MESTPDSHVSSVSPDSRVSGVSPDSRVSGVSIEALLEHADWVRALARRLVRDTARADDAVQETWIEALIHPPRDAENPRGWLAAVLRSTLRRGARGDARRTTRERLAARPEAQPSAAELLERARLQRELAGHVLELREPYRTVLLMRWFEGLTEDR